MHEYAAFERLTEERKERIIRACMEVFAEKGYVSASTNDIVKRAGISKGILFHYFGSKKNLYLYILDKAIDTALKKIKADYIEVPADPFERIAKIGMLKLKLALQEPLLYKIIFSAFINTPDSIKEDAMEKYRKLYGIAMQMFYDGLDLSKIRTGIDPGKAIEVIMLFIEALQSKYFKEWENTPADRALKSMDKLMEETGVYMDILKKGIYE